MVNGHVLHVLINVPWVRLDEVKAVVHDDPADTVILTLRRKRQKYCAGHRSTPIYEQLLTPPPKAPRGSQGGPLQSKSFQQKHSPIDIFKRCHINANIVILLNLFVIVGWHT